MSRVATGLVVVLLGTLLTACNSDSGPKAAPVPASFTFKVDVRLSGARNVFGGLDRCSGVGVFADMHRGAHVTVTNEIGKPIAIGTISFSLGTNYYQDVLDECSFRVLARYVPRAKGYFVVIGRGKAQPFSLASVVATNGVLTYDANPPLVTPNVPQ